MTLTQRRDGEAGASYLELVELLQRQGADTLGDTHQLFRRIVFSILIHNTDDHLRNHGFFVEDRGLRLSPAYDINPSIDRDDLTLAINETETACDVEIARAAHRMYALSLKKADGLIAEVACGCEDVARRGGGIAHPALGAGSDGFCVCCVGIAWFAMPSGRGLGPRGHDAVHAGIGDRLAHVFVGVHDDA